MVKKKLPKNTTIENQLFMLRTVLNTIPDIKWNKSQPLTTKACFVSLEIMLNRNVLWTLQMASQNG